MIKGCGRIYSTDEKMAIFATLDVDEVIVADFAAVMNIDADSFILDSIIRDMNAVCAVSGEDFRFGHRGEGTAQLLKAACEVRGMPCVVVSEQTVDGVRVSSTHIRTLLEKGDTETAVNFLGHPHILSGTVISALIYGALTTASYSLLSLLGKNLIVAAIVVAAGVGLLLLHKYKIKKKRIFLLGIVCILLGVLSALTNLGGFFADVPWLAVGIPAITSFYFDWFGGCIQAFIFCTLTTIFIKQAAGE